MQCGPSHVKCGCNVDPPQHHILNVDVMWSNVDVLWSNVDFHISNVPGRIAQSVTCLATDACLTADPGVLSSIPARSHTFVETDHEIISFSSLPLIHSRRVTSFAPVFSLIYC